MTTLLHPNLEKATAGKIDLNVKSIIKESWHKVHGFKATYWKAFFLMFISMLLLNILLALPTVIFAWQGESALASTTNLVEDFFNKTISALFSISLIYIAINHIAERPINAKMIFVFRERFKELILPAIFIAFLSFLILYLFESVKPLFYSFDLRIDVILLIISIFSLLLILGTVLTAFYMSMLVVLDKKLNGWKAIKIVARIYAKNFFKLLGFSLIITLFSFSCLLLSLGIGLIWLFPMVSNIMAITYRQIFGIEQIG